MQKKIISHNIGRRKSATARVFLEEGTGNIFINNKTIQEYFPYYLDQRQILIPLLLTKLLNDYNFTIKVMGGGRVGQIGAIQLGIARAICSMDSSKRGLLKQQGLLSRDARVKERRKYGLKKARKASQYSKR